MVLNSLRSKRFLSAITSTFWPIQLIIGIIEPLSFQETEEIDVCHFTEKRGCNGPFVYNQYGPTKCNMWLKRFNKWSSNVVNFWKLISVTMRKIERRALHILLLNRNSSTPFLLNNEILIMCSGTLIDYCKWSRSC